MFEFNSLQLKELYDLAFEIYDKELLEKLIYTAVMADMKTNEYGFALDLLWKYLYWRNQLPHEDLLGVEAYTTFLTEILEELYDYVYTNPFRVSSGKSFETHLQEYTNAVAEIKKKYAHLVFEFSL